MNKTSPILFLIFNRPDTTRKVFEAIRQEKPRQFFIAADGPRLDRAGELEKCDEAREIIKEVDWPCELKILLRDNNLGCKVAVQTAIDWFFSFVEEGIILEDDCLPDPSFFGFCTLILDKYRTTESVKVISGTNFLFGKFDVRNAYYFSTFMPIWGWATWKRAWNQVTFTVPNFEQFRLNKTLEKKFSNNRFSKWLYNMLQSTFIGEIDAWSPYMVYTFAMNNGAGVSPYRNLISNIGVDGVHVNSIDSHHPSFNMATRSIDLKTMQYLDSIWIDTICDKITFRYILRVDGKKTLLDKVINKAKRLMKL